MPIESPGNLPTPFTTALRDFPFLRLSWHFIQNLFRAGQSEGDLDASMGALLGLLTLPGVFLSLSLFDKYSSLQRFLRGTRAQDHYVISIPDKYFFIVFAMVVTGLVTVWKWDRILPNRQDHVNLAPLPLSANRIFYANLIAILTVIAVFAISVNAGSTFLFPLIVTAEAGDLTHFLTFVLVHAIVVIAATAFTFFTCLAILGTMLAALPPAWFLRFSIPIRMSIVAMLLALLGTSFTLPAFLRQPPDWLHWIPSIWFLSWYQQLQNRATPSFEDWGSRALPATLLAFAVAMLAYLISYRRSFLKIPESAGLAQRGTREQWPWVRRLLEATLFRTPFERATAIFTLRALSRHESHLILLTAFFAMALVTAAQAAANAFNAPPGIAAPSANWLSVPLILAYFTAFGLRLVVDLPAQIEANWIFRAVLPPGDHSSANILRKLILSLIAAFICLPTLLAFSYRWTLFAGLAHSAFVFLLSFLLTELLLRGYRKIPATCSLPPFERHAPVLFLCFWIGFVLFTWGASNAHRAMMLHPERYLVLLLLTGVCLYFLREWDREIPHVDRELLFHDSGTRAFERLELGA